jgi:hypothetical protein
MRTFKTILLVAVITFSCALSASATEKTLETSITNEIGKLLNNPKFIIEHDVQAFVRIVFNEDNEIVVMSVDSDSKMINNFIKSRLNYKKLADNVIDKDQAYIVPIRITSEE